MRHRKTIPLRPQTKSNRNFASLECLRCQCNQTGSVQLAGNKNLWSNYQSLSVVNAKRNSSVDESRPISLDSPVASETLFAHSTRLSSTSPQVNRILYLHMTLTLGKRRSALP